MLTIPVAIPQLGEGLVDAVVLSLLKAEGDPIERDEPLFELETEKAAVVVESPVAGILGSWAAQPGQKLPVGFVLATVIAENGSEAGINTAPPDVTVNAATAHSLPGVAGSQDEASHQSAGEERLERGPRNSAFSPRVRAYCSERGITLEQMQTIPVENPDGRLQIADIQRWETQPASEGYRDRPLPVRQKALSDRLARGWRQVVTAALEVECNWDALQAARLAIRRCTHDAICPSALEMIAWCVTRSMENHPKLRSALVGESHVREFNSVCLGVAVSLPDDELAVAAIPSADRLDFPSFVASLRDRVKRIHEGETTTDSVQVTISYMAPEGILSGWPNVVPPSVATLLVCAPYPVPTPGPDGQVIWRKRGRLILNFDHRLINGVGAARFIRQIRKRIDQLMHDLPLQGPHATGQSLSFSESGTFEHP